MRVTNLPPSRRSTVLRGVCQSSEAAFHCLMSSGLFHAPQTVFTSAFTSVSTVIFIWASPSGKFFVKLAGPDLDREAELLAEVGGGVPGSDLPRFFHVLRLHDEEGAGLLGAVGVGPGTVLGFAVPRHVGAPLLRERERADDRHLSRCLQPLVVRLAGGRDLRRLRGSHAREGGGVVVAEAEEFHLAASLSLAMSSLTILSIACITRSAFFASLPAKSSPSMRGFTCQDRPYLSLSQPHCTGVPPATSFSQ